MNERSSFLLGDWRVDPELRTIRRGRVTKRLEPKLMAVLLCLVDRAGEPVARETLEGEVWPGAVIGPDTLNRAVSKIRRLLEDKRGGQALIETIPKVGYRLVVSVRSASDDVKASRITGITVSVAGLVVAAGISMLLVVSGRAGTTDTLGIESVLPLTSDLGYESRPSISPNGDFDVYQRYDRAGSLQPNWDILAKRVGDTEPRVIAGSDSHELAPAWSPSGDSIAFITSSTTSCHIVLTHAFSPGLRTITDCDPDLAHQLSWFPDGTSLALSRSGGAQPGIFRLALTTGLLERLTTVPADHVADLHPRVSPNGKHVAFIRSRTFGISDVYMLDLSDKHVSRLTFDERRIDGLDWMPSGRELIFSSNRGGNSHLWRIRSSGRTEPVRIAMSGRNASNLSVASSGDVVYEEYSGDSNIWAQREGQRWPWTTGTRSEASPRYSPDGSRVAFVSDQSGSAEVWLADRDGSNATQLTDLRGAVLDPPRWADNGASLVYAAAVNGNFDVYVVNGNSGEIRQLTDDLADDRAPSWFPEQHAYLFSSKRSGTWQLWKLADGVSVQLTTNGAFAGQSLSDSIVLFTKPTEPGLWSLNPATSNESLIWQDVQAGDWANWSISRDRVFYLRVFNTDKPTLTVFDLDTGAISTVPTNMTEAPTLSGVVASPDDNTLLYSRVDSSESDLWIMKLRLE